MHRNSAAGSTLAKGVARCTAALSSMQVHWRHPPYNLSTHHAAGAVLCVGNYPGAAAEPPGSGYRHQLVFDLFGSARRTRKIVPRTRIFCFLSTQINMLVHEGLSRIILLFLHYLWAGAFLR